MSTDLNDADLDRIERHLAEKRMLAHLPPPPIPPAPGTFDAEWDRKDKERRERARAELQAKEERLRHEREEQEERARKQWAKNAGRRKRAVERLAKVQRDLDDAERKRDALHKTVATLRREANE